MCPPTLRQLAVESLLKDQALAISALEFLPWNLFSTLFIEVVVKRHMEVLKAMVPAWPFPCLPLGALMSRADLATLQVILETLDMLLEQEVWPRCKLRVIDLRDMSPNIWTLGYIAMSRVCSAVNHCAEMTEEPPFSVVIDVVIDDGPQDNALAHLLQWAEARKGQVQLCSRKMKILLGSTSKIQSILRVLHLDSILELVVDDLWNQRTVENTIAYLGRMKNLRILSLSKMNAEYWNSGLNSFFMQLLQQKSLQQIYMHQFFVYGKLHKVLRILKPLTTLSLSCCALKEADLRHLSQCPCTSQLKHLYLRNLFMGHFSPEPLRALLEKVTDTLETLVLEHCEITEAQLSAILPTLSQCSHLKLFSFYGNPMSLATLQNLLSHTARLSHLSGGLYPAPLESYRHRCLCQPKVNKERFAQVCQSLVQILRDIKPSHKVQICTYSCIWCEKCQFYSLAPSGNWVVTEKYPFPSEFRYYGVCVLH
ncbi:PRAME family member 8-like isoform 1-T3 [Thomomys bottae]